ncbi:S8 family peptidase [Idiomarina abyssalis]|uniref:S8 family peptidase n=1 Tax=Idiomarina abyssalis TaxID=86102 RepID=UPI0006C8B689|nr:S8 family serine peptidase [Idiomarina abyssalis]KPD21917.1 hypothetical protein ADS78_05555 [Idiomarina abyssalis]SFT65867.1 Subtilase family protein [Idiomarina abyssalis]
MKKLIIASALSVVFASAHADENDHINVSLIHKATNTEVVSVSKANVAHSVNRLVERDTETRCVPAGNTGGEWCVPVRDTSIRVLGEMTVQNGHAAPSLERSIRPISSVKLERHGLSDQEMIEALMATGLFESVEVHYNMKNFKMQSQSADIPFLTGGIIHDGPDYNLFDDEYYKAQRLSMYRVGDSMMSSGIASVMARGQGSSLPKAKMFVIDGGFSDSEDVPYSRGVNMVSWGDTSREFEPDNITPRGDVESCTGHGLSAAGVMGATRDNEQGVAGVAGNADVMALRALNCGDGAPYDTYDANDWLSGIPVQYHDDVYEGEPGVVNMSYGGSVTLDPSLEEEFPCGYSGQLSIDNMQGAGFIPVVAAGNDSKEAKLISPATCRDVITVGAMDQNGQLAGFSNYGHAVDVFAPGVQVYADGTPYGMPEDVEMRVVNGTSFAAPIVSGLIAETKRHFPELNFKMAELLLKQTAFDPMLNNSPKCEDGKCGAGRIDGEAFFLAVEAWSNGRLNTVSHALSGVSEAEQQWYVDNFDAQGMACESFQVDFFNGHSKLGDTYKVVSAAKGTDFETGAFTEVGQYTSGSVVLSDIDPESSDYAFQVCTEDGGCDGEFYEFNTQGASAGSRPAVCTG